MHRRGPGDADELQLQLAQLKFLRENFRGKDVSYFHPGLNGWVIPIPKDFSLISNPAESLDAIYSVLAVSQKRPRNMIFDHRACRNMDLGASAVLDVVALGVSEEWQNSGEHFAFSGYFPENRKVRDIVQCMGLTKHLRVRGAEAPADRENRFHKFPLFCGTRQAASRMTGPSDQERAATELAQFINGCFEIASDYTFSTEGRRHIVSWAGEVITNAEEHSDGSHWYAIAFMIPVKGRDEKSNTQRIFGECQLSIFNFGRSIHQSLSHSDTPQKTRSQIESLVQKHTSGFFRGDLFSAQGFGPPELWTLYALQEGISRFAPSPGEIDRGKGTVKMIAAFQALGDTLDTKSHPEMTLISGSSRILFTKKYPMVSVQMEGGERHIIAFNESNTLQRPPDPDYVHSLPAQFPGTVLTFKFFVDRKYLDAHVHARNSASQGAADEENRSK